MAASKPAHTSDAVWWFVNQCLTIPGAEFSGTYAAKPGYHNFRFALSTTDYSVGNVANDRMGDGNLCSAVDIKLPPAEMERRTQWLWNAAVARDPRLYINGNATIREFIGTRNGTSVDCYVMTGGVALGVGADVGPDWDRDSTHLWHIHWSIIRRFADSWQAMSQLWSIVSGESLASWKARQEPAPEPQLQEDNMPVIIPIPPGYGYDENGVALNRKSIVSIPLPPVGNAGNPFVGKSAMFVALAGDHINPDEKLLVRVAIYDGAGWNHTIYNVPSRGRVGVTLPTPKNGTAFNMTVGRVMRAPEADVAQGEGDIPCSVLVEIYS
jgi:hypothetical protein